MAQGAGHQQLDPLPHWERPLHFLLVDFPRTSTRSLSPFSDSNVKQRLVPGLKTVISIWDWGGGLFGLYSSLLRCERWHPMEPSFQKHNVSWTELHPSKPIDLRGHRRCNSVEDCIFSLLDLLPRQLKTWAVLSALLCPPNSKMCDRWMLSRCYPAGQFFRHCSNHNPL